MRKAECPWPDSFGGLDGGGLPHYLFYSQHGDEKFLGPFSDEPTLVAAIVGNYPDYKARFYKKYIARVIQGHQPTLAHEDVQQKNIMVVENTSCPHDQDGRSFDVVLIDWENSGWFPLMGILLCILPPYIRVG